MFELSDAEALLEKVRANIAIDPATGCWNWQGSLSLGYGRIGWHGKSDWTHRVAYQLIRGPIQAGLCIDHLCLNKACANPAHMEVVTIGENVRRAGGFQKAYARRRAATHCKHGHELSGSNLKITPEGHRSCRTCSRDRMRATRALLPKKPRPVAVQCKAGHLFTAETTRFANPKGGHPQRVCLICQRRWLKERAARRRAEREASKALVN